MREISIQGSSISVYPVNQKIEELKAGLGEEAKEKAFDTHKRFKGGVGVGEFLGEQPPTEVAGGFVEGLFEVLITNFEGLEILGLPGFKVEDKFGCGLKKG
jgi:hypothetical protein